MKVEASNARRIVSRKRQFGRVNLTAEPKLVDMARRGQSALQKVLFDLSGLDSDAAKETLLHDTLKQLDALLADNSRLGRQVAGLARRLAKARAFAYHDELTGLPNRRLLLDHFRQARAHAQRRRERLALLFIDLDGFKGINDRFGHLAGDTILKEVAARLMASVRDDETASRFSGDEFVVLLSDCENGDAAEIVVERIRARLSEPYVLDGTTFELTASIGMTIYPDDGREYAELIQASDKSMLSQKRRGPVLPEGP